MSVITVELKVLRFTNKCIVATDETGRERWIGKDTSDYRLDGDDIVLNIDKKKWDRRNQAVPKELEPKNDTEFWTRKCLCCGVEKKLERMMFVCYDCKETSLWRSAA